MKNGVRFFFFSQESKLISSFPRRRRNLKFLNLFVLNWQGNAKRRKNNTSSLVVFPVKAAEEITDFTYFPLCSFRVAHYRLSRNHPATFVHLHGRILSCRGTLGEKGLSRADCLELPGIQLHHSRAFESRTREFDSKGKWRCTSDSPAYKLSPISSS